MSMRKLTDKESGRTLSWLVCVHRNWLEVLMEYKVYHTDYKHQQMDETLYTRTAMPAMALINVHTQVSPVISSNMAEASAME